MSEHSASLFDKNFRNRKEQVWCDVGVTSIFSFSYILLYMIKELNLYLQQSLNMNRLKAFADEQNNYNKEDDFCTFRQHLHKPNSSRLLTLLQTKYLDSFQTERVCRCQFQI